MHHSDKNFEYSISPSKLAVHIGTQRKSEAGLASFQSGAAFGLVDRAAVGAERGEQGWS